VRKKERLLAYSENEWNIEWWVGLWGDLNGREFGEGRYRGCCVSAKGNERFEKEREGKRREKRGWGRNGRE
jgi:hypothetical protein